MEVTPAGILMFRSEVQRLKAASPIAVSYTHLESGIETSHTGTCLAEDSVLGSDGQVAHHMQHVSATCLLYTSTRWN